MSDNPGVTQIPLEYPCQHGQLKAHRIAGLAEWCPGGCVHWLEVSTPIAEKWWDGKPVTHPGARV